MAERSPEQLLAAYRDATGPSPAVEQRMLAGLHARIASPPPASPPSGAAIGGAGLKLVVLVAVVAGLGALAARLLDQPAPKTATEPAASAAALAVSVETPARPMPRVVEPVVEEVVESSPASPRSAEANASVTRKRAAKTRRRAPHVVAQPNAKPATRSSADDLAAEAQLLRAADLALRRGRLDDAEAHLDEHARQFTRGALAAQAELLRVLVGCARDQPDAKQRAAKLWTNQPTHPARARLEQACE